MGFILEKDAQKELETLRKVAIAQGWAAALAYAAQTIADLRGHLTHERHRREAAEKLIRTSTNELEVESAPGASGNREANHG